MGRKNENDEPQSQSMPGPTGDNPNADREDGNQGTVQPGQGTGNTVGGDTTGDVAPGAPVTPAPGSGSVPSDGGNPAANQGGTSSQS